MLEQFTEMLPMDNQFFAGGLTLSVLVGGWQLLRSVPSRIWPFIRRRIIFTASIDTAYNGAELNTINSWLIRHGYGHKVGHMYYNRYSGAYSPGNILVWVRYKGHCLLIQHSHEDESTDTGSKTRKSSHVTGLKHSRQAVLDLVSEIQGTPTEDKEGMTKVITEAPLFRRDSWVTARRSDTLWLPEGQYEDLINDVKQFNQSREEYIRLGVPYHRAWLLQGPPGTGKSSIIQAVASDLGRAILVLEGIQNFTASNLITAMLDCAGQNAIMLIEDVDATGVGKENAKPDEERAITLADLLNALDGIGTPPGLQIFMTTNHPERISPRLLRPGRVDKVVDVGYITPEVAHQMAEHFLPGCTETAEEMARWAESEGVTPADVQGELLKRKFNA